MESFNYKSYVIPHMTEVFTTATKLPKDNELHVFPLNKPKFESQKETF